MQEMRALVQSHKARVMSVQKKRTSGEALQTSIMRGVKSEKSQDEFILERQYRVPSVLEPSLDPKPFPGKAQRIDPRRVPVLIASFLSVISDHTVHDDGWIATSFKPTTSTHANVLSRGHGSKQSFDVPDLGASTSSTVSFYRFTGQTRYLNGPASPQIRVADKATLQ